MSAIGLVERDVAEFEPGEVRYIKLGTGSAWAEEAIERAIVPLGYREIDHGLCLESRWEAVREQLIASGWTASGASQGVRELRDFYELPADTLWVTFADGHLYWCFSEAGVAATEEGQSDGPSRYRRVRGGWHRDSLTGEALSIRNLSSALTRTANYRMTICKVEQQDYLLRRIRGDIDARHRQAGALKSEMRQLALGMIRQLHWEEFETLVDLIFARGGWRRTSLLGQDMPDVDLVLDQPVTRETAWVQVKTATRQSELEDYVRRFERDGSCDRLFFVCHSAAGTLTMPPDPRRHLLEGEHLAEMAIDVGLFDWLMARTR